MCLSSPKLHLLHIPLWMAAPTYPSAVSPNLEGVPLPSHTLQSTSQVTPESILNLPTCVILTATASERPPGPSYVPPKLAVPTSGAPQIHSPHSTCSFVLNLKLIRILSGVKPSWESSPQNGPKAWHQAALAPADLAWRHSPLRSHWTSPFLGLSLLCPPLVLGCPLSWGENTCPFASACLVYAAPTHPSGPP